jgi:hypothetical protein
MLKADSYTVRQVQGNLGLFFVSLVIHLTFRPRQLSLKRPAQGLIEVVGPALAME